MFSFWLLTNREESELSEIICEKHQVLKVLTDSVLHSCNIVGLMMDSLF